MSMEPPNPTCQKLVTNLHLELQPFWDEVASRATTNHAPLHAPLDSQTRPVAVASHPASYTTSLTVIPDDTFSQEATSTCHWADLLQLSSPIISLSYPLSDQEQEGSIQTTTSTAWHTYLLAQLRQQPYRLLISQQTAAAPTPDPQMYRQLCLELTVGKSLRRDHFLEQLIHAGYIRHQTSLEPGSFRVRGEQIDLTHPTVNGHLSILFFGNTVEQLVHHRGQRSQTLPYYLLPPLRFPNNTTGWTQLPFQLQITNAHFEPAPTPTIVTSPTSHPDLAFPFSAVPQSDIHNPTDHTFLIFNDASRKNKYIDQLPPQEQEQATTCFHDLAHTALHVTASSWSIRTEASIYPPETTTTSPISSVRAQELIGALNPGSPAVHADHGIGIYQGLQTKSVQDLPREYLILEYAAGDSLAVPVEFAHKVSPYVGADHPPIHRLGGSSWQKTKKKAQTDALQFAQELLRTGKKRHGTPRPPYRLDPDLDHQLDQSFPFDLTSDQQRTWEEIRQDLTSNQPMDRLIVGDVGFGKTELALRAARHVVANGGQVAVLAPTTLLVQQHFDTFQERLSDINNNIHLLSRFITTQEQTATKQAIQDGSAAIAIGTHALLSPSTQWYNLQLIIIDEEQRFGVKQKEHFKKLRASIDILSLSATPIPRTLSQALSGLRSLSVITTPPTGRKSIISTVKKADNQLVTNAITRELDRGGQVYVVAPKIRHLASLQEHLAALVPHGQFALAHGRLPDDQLARIIHDFDAGTINVLVSSSIVENGLDLPRANTMIVWHAPHFGLAELYQLRGRIGRRTTQGYAYFLYNQTKLTSIQRQRLAALTEASRLGSGWELARRDLEIRGAGNLLGAEQSGSVNSVGAALYLDMIRQAVDQEEGDTSAPAADVDIQLPFPTIIPANYISNDTQRVRWYGRLTRAKTRSEIDDLRQQLTQEYGHLTPEVTNLLLSIELAHAAAPYKITTITSQTIDPGDEDPYHRLVLTTTNPKPALEKLGHLGNWQVRGYDLTWDTDQITPEIIQKITQTLEES